METSNADTDYCSCPGLRPGWRVLRLWPLGRWRRCRHRARYDSAYRAGLLSAGSCLKEQFAATSAGRVTAASVETWRPEQLPIGQTAKARSGYCVQSLHYGRDRQYETNRIQHLLRGKVKIDRLFNADR